MLIERHLVCLQTSARRARRHPHARRLADDDAATAVEPEDNQRIWDTANACPRSSSRPPPRTPPPRPPSSRQCEMLKEREACYQEVREPLFDKEASKKSPSTEAAASKRLPRVPTPSIPRSILFRSGVRPSALPCIDITFFSTPALLLFAVYPSYVRLPRLPILRHPLDIPSPRPVSSSGTSVLLRPCTFDAATHPRPSYIKYPPLDLPFPILGRI
ncbi:hypothetical protein B0H17DRAFT_1203123 [Mycena rosella]|uniref:Uncharacterized protein n=1 Tax=Mycena rosella TaxID=1033263 RepID=A0AAD7DCJ7_MYCRO|nr:hypothetical protein B0H17DRAFT_1203123 [Mycena rosella]